MAHGAKEACLRFSKSNVSGSLGIAYGSAGHDLPLPFLVSLDKEDPVHLLDSHNLAIVLAELDTIYDLNAYLDAKEAAIRDLDSLAYCGEEDLLGHYFYDNPATRAYFIGVPDGKYNGLFIGEGEWRSFVYAAAIDAEKGTMPFLISGMINPAHVPKCTHGCADRQRQHL